MRLQGLIAFAAASCWSLACLPAVSAAVSPNPDPTFHIPRIGVPKISTLSSASPFLTPRFHRLIRADEDKAKKTNTAVFVASEQGGFGALNPRNGEIVWRRVVNDTDPVQGFWLSADGELQLALRELVIVVLEHLDADDPCLSTRIHSRTLPHRQGRRQSYSAQRTHRPTDMDSASDISRTG